MKNKKNAQYDHIFKVTRFLQMSLYKRYYIQKNSIFYRHDCQRHTWKVGYNDSDKRLKDDTVLPRFRIIKNHK